MMVGQVECVLVAFCGVTLLDWFGFKGLCVGLTSYWGLFRMLRCVSFCGGLQVA